MIICMFEPALRVKSLSVPLLSAEPPWDEGEEDDDELEEVLCNMASKESSDRCRSGLLKHKNDKRSHTMSNRKLFF